MSNTLTRLGASAAFPGYPAAVAASGLLFLSGVRPAGSGPRPLLFDDLSPEAQVGRQGFPLVEEAEEEVAVDAWAAHDELDRVLALAGATQDHMLRMRIWQRDKRFYPSYERVRLIRQPSPSSSSGHSVKALGGIGGRAIGIDGVAIAVDQAGTGSDRIATGQTGQAERPLTYYSLAAQHGDYAFLAGHIPVKQEPGFPTVQSFDDVPPEGRGFATGRSHTDSRDGPIAAQAWYVYDQLRQSLEKIGGTLDQLVHCLVGLADIRDLPMFHRIHRDLFGDAGPALTIVGAGEVGHRNSRLVVEPTVYLASEGTGRFEWQAQAPLSAPLARRGGNLLFLSGMSAFGPNGRLVGGPDALPPEAQALLRSTQGWSRTPGLSAQCWQALANLSQSLSVCGSSTERLVKLTLFMSDTADWPVFEAVRRSFLPEGLPAIECVVVPHPGPSANSAIQIDAIAQVG